MSSDCHTALAVVSSNIFGLDLFSAGMTSHEQKRMMQLKIYSSTLLENVPQIVFQWLYYSVASLTPTLVFASTASMLSILTALLMYCIERDDDGEALHYYLALERTRFSSPELSSGAMTARERTKIEYHRGFRKAMSRSLTRFWGIPDKTIEIGSTIITKTGAITHIVHLMSIEDAQDFAVELFGDDAKMGVPPLVVVRQFYELKRMEISELFRDHFHLGQEFSVTFYDSTDKRKLTVHTAAPSLSMAGMAGLSALPTQLPEHSRSVSAPSSGMTSSGVDGHYLLMKEDSGRRSKV